MEGPQMELFSQELLKGMGLLWQTVLQEKVSGVITRRRITVVRNEESAIAFVVISSDMAEELVEIVTDEDRDHVLTSLTKTKNGTKINESDQNSILTKFNLKWKAKEKDPKIEIFNLNDKEGQRKFQEMTSNNTKLSSKS